MANIPVERTGTGTPWWLWLLGLVLLLGGLWLVAELFDNEPDADEIAGTDDNVGVIDDVEIGDDDAVVAGATAGAMANGLDLSNLYVTRVVGDRTFYVAPSEAQSGTETLVILDQNMSPDAAGIEGQVDINPGQRISIDGDMEPLGDMNLAGMGLSDADASAMGPDTNVIRADGGDVEILDAPMGVDNVEAGQ